MIALDFFINEEGIPISPSYSLHSARSRLCPLDLFFDVPTPAGSHFLLDYIWRLLPARLSFRLVQASPFQSQLSHATNDKLR